MVDAPRGDHDVAGLEVAVDEPLGVGRFQGEGHGPDDLEFVPHIEIRRRLVEGPALEELHGNEGSPGPVHPVMDLADIRMIELGQGEGLTPESLRRTRFPRLTHPQGLQGHTALQGGIPRPVDFAHAATAQQGFHPEASDLGAGLKNPSSRGLGQHFLGVVGHFAPAIFLP